jgi:hypothetical protein
MMIRDVSSSLRVIGPDTDGAGVGVGGIVLSMMRSPGLSGSVRQIVGLVGGGVCASAVATTASARIPDAANAGHFKKERIALLPHMNFPRRRFILGPRLANRGKHRLMPDNFLLMRMKPRRKGDRFSEFVVGGGVVSNLNKFMAVILFSRQLTLRLQV